MSSFLFEKPPNLNTKAARQAKKKVSNIKVATKIKNSLEAKLKLFSEKGDGWIEVTMPIVTVSEANGGVKISYIRNGKKYYKSEHWSDQHRRHRLQKGTVALSLHPHRSDLSLPCIIKLTRYAPDKLDRYDNLPMSMKWILDAVCEIITGDYRPGRADSNEEIRDVTYSQEFSNAYGVKVRIQATT